jgi:hypothetical protein
VSHCRKFCYNLALGADVAQLVEQRIRNAKVASSIPAIGTISIRQNPPVGGFCILGIGAENGLCDFIWVDTIMVRALTINTTKKIAKSPDMNIQQALNALFEVMDNKINCRKLLKEFIGESAMVKFNGAHDCNKVSVEVVITGDEIELSPAACEGIAQYVQEFVTTCFKTERFLNQFNPFLVLAEIVVTVNGAQVFKLGR